MFMYQPGMKEMVDLMRMSYVALSSIPDQEIPGALSSEFATTGELANYLKHVLLACDGVKHTELLARRAELVAKRVRASGAIAEGSRAA